MTKQVFSNTLLFVLVLFPLALVSGQSRPNVNAVEKEPQDAMSLILAARGLTEKGKDLDRALAYVKRAMSLPAIPNDAVPRHTFFLTLALVQIKRGEFDEAITTLTTRQEASPAYVRLDHLYLEYLGMAYEGAGRIDEAIETLITLAGGRREVSVKPSERLVALYQKRFGSLDGLNEKIEANRLATRRKYYAESQLLNIPAPEWSLQDLNGRDVSSSDFANRILVLRFINGLSRDDVEDLKYLQKQYEEYESRGIAFVCIQIGYPHPIEQRRAEIRQALDQTGFTIPILIDPDYGVAKRFRETEKSIILIDEKGIIRFRLSLWNTSYHTLFTEQIAYLLTSK
jgi:tetratricopeptide (TPR) repeat protein